MEDIVFGNLGEHCPNEGCSGSFWKSPDGDLICTKCKSRFGLFLTKKYDRRQKNIQVEKGKRHWDKKK